MAEANFEIKVRDLKEVKEAFQILRFRFLAIIFLCVVSLGLGLFIPVYSFFQILNIVLIAFLAFGALRLELR